MFIVSKRNILLPSPDGSQVVPIQKDFIGEIPDWAAETAYFKGLVKDGKIGVPSSRKDQQVVLEAEKPVRRKKPTDDKQEHKPDQTDGA